MNWFTSLFRNQSSQPAISFRAVDWMGVEARVRSIKQLAASTDQAQKKQAIIQFDMTVDDILKQAQVPGATMGERLKAVAAKLSKQVNAQIWQAHKKRNELVHENGSFVADWELTQYMQNFEVVISEMRGKP